MNRERRSAVIPVPYQIPLICYPRKRKKKPKKIIPQECQYQTIPFPIKFVYTCGIYSFYGGITLREHNGTLRTETPLLSQFFRCSEIEVITKQNTKIISVPIAKLPHFQLPAWQHMTEKLVESDSPDLRQWGGLIKDYCLKYEDKLRAWANKENFFTYSEEFLENMNKESERQTDYFFATYPCINFKATMRENTMHLSAIVLNETYLEALGYTIDSFAVAALQEGLPQMMPADNTYAVKMLMENYYSLEKGDCHTPELASELTLKKGYTRKINYKVHYFATYIDGVFGIDCVLMLTNKEPATIQNFPESSESYLNKKFIKKAVKKEKEGAKFMEKYYNAPSASSMEYTNADKICQIKYIDQFES